jgi:hypothetical protein
MGSWPTGRADAYTTGAPTKPAERNQGVLLSVEAGMAFLDYAKQPALAALRGMRIDQEKDEDEE